MVGTDNVEVLDESKCRCKAEGVDILPTNCKTDCRKAYNIYKDPVTDDGTKKSLKGLLCVIQDGPDSYMVKEECTPEWENKGLLQTIYINGEFHNQTTLTEIRKKLE